MALSDLRNRALDEPAVSVVIVHRNTPVRLSECLAAMPAAAAGVPLEIVVVDDFSAAANRPDLKSRRGLGVVFNDVARGYAAAANQGACLARAGRLLFLDCAMELAPAAIPRLLEILRDDTRLAAVAPVVTGEGAVRLPSMRFLTAFNRAFGLFGFGGRRRVVLPAHAPAVMLVDWLERRAMLVRADVFRALGGFDDGFPVHAQDEDLCWRARRRGYGVAVACEVCVREARSASAARARAVVSEDFYRAELRFLGRRAGIAAMLPYRCGVSLALLARALGASLARIGGRRRELQGHRRAAAQPLDASAQGRGARMTVVSVDCREP